MANQSENSDSRDEDAGKYTVVARRYRPRNFEELVGQETVVQALSTAIRTGRVGHAYLFTGARGVGKTSTARIFAKALNSPGGPNSCPDLETDVAQAIDAGQDMDVIEIDGASNRGIEEIRSLRANVNVRPSRSRYKIYIIDEVHMLTVQAFNALLKTLEEPPEHVKFFFCTTDPEKIPVTVLSRCQRFDFAPVKTESILDRLRLICSKEGVVADDDALRLIARKAAGSMRDSQSLLEQILSFADGAISVDQVHAILGSADESMLLDTTRMLMERDAAGVLVQVEKGIGLGVDPGQFAEQLLGMFRDILVATMGCDSELLRTANPNSLGLLKQMGLGWGTATLLAAIQLLDGILIKMRHSVQNRILFEVALVQITQLQDLQRLSDIVSHLQSQTSGSSIPNAVPRAVARPESKSGDSDAILNGLGTERPDVAAGDSRDLSKKKRDESLDSATPSLLNASSTSPVSSNESKFEEQGSVRPATSCVQVPFGSLENEGQSIQQVWEAVLNRVDSFVADYLRMAIRAEAVNPKTWQIIFPAGSDLAVDFCKRSENIQTLMSAIRAVIGESRELNWVISHERVTVPVQSVMATRPVSSAQRTRELMTHPWIASICEAFGGEITRVDPPRTKGSPHFGGAGEHLPSSKEPKLNQMESHP